MKKGTRQRIPSSEDLPDDDPRVVAIYSSLRNWFAYARQTDESSTDLAQRASKYLIWKLERLKNKENA